MSKIRVLAIPPDQHGAGKFRILNPYTHLQEKFGDDFHIDISMKVVDDNKSFDGYDVVVFHTAIHHGSPFSRTLDRIDWLKKNDITVILDMDDYWELDMRHPLFNQVKHSDIGKNKIEAIKKCDNITVTTLIFKKTILSKFNNKNVFVLPNAIDPNENQFRPNPIQSNRIRFGWLGGSSHLHDIELMRNGIANILTNYKEKVQFVLCGYDLRGNITEINKSTGEKKVRPIKPQESVWYQYEKIFTDNYNGVTPIYESFLHTFKKGDFPITNETYVRRWTEPVTTYATNYNHFDVSLAPLVPTVFNSNKSQLKAIEAGFYKKALIASETDPYTIDLVSAIDKGGGFNPKGNSLLVSSSKNHKQWFQHMKRLIENPNLIVDLGNKLYETVSEKYSLDVVTTQRAEILKTITNKKK